MSTLGIKKYPFRTETIVLPRSNKYVKIDTEDTDVIQKHIIDFNNEINFHSTNINKIYPLGASVGKITTEQKTLDIFFSIYDSSLKNNTIINTAIIDVIQDSVFNEDMKIIASKFFNGYQYDINQSYSYAWYYIALSLFFDSNSQLSFGKFIEANEKLVDQFINEEDIEKQITLHPTVKKAVENIHIPYKTYICYLPTEFSSKAHLSNIYTLSKNDFQNIVINKTGVSSRKTKIVSDLKRAKEDVENQENELSYEDQNPNKISALFLKTYNDALYLCMDKKTISDNFNFNAINIKDMQSFQDDMIALVVKWDQGGTKLPYEKQVQNNKLYWLIEKINIHKDVLDPAAALIFLHSITFLTRTFKVKNKVQEISDFVTEFRNRYENSEDSIEFMKKFNNSLMINMYAYLKIYTEPIGRMNSINELLNDSLMENELPLVLTCNIHYTEKANKQLSIKSQSKIEKAIEIYAEEILNE